MTALLAANMLTASESHARRAVTADVGDRGAVDGHTAALVGKGILAAHRGHLVGFTRHDDMDFFVEEEVAMTMGGLAKKGVARSWC